MIEILDVARRAFALCAEGSITLREMVTIFRLLGLAEVPLHHVL